MNCIPYTVYMYFEIASLTRLNEMAPTEIMIQAAPLKQSFRMMKIVWVNGWYCRRLSIHISELFKVHA